MKTRIAFVIGAGLGYIWGTRAGRQKYEDLRAKFDQVWEHPSVQTTREHLEETIRTTVDTRLPRLAGKATTAIRDAFGLELPPH